MKTRKHENKNGISDIGDYVNSSLDFLVARIPDHNIKKGRTGLEVEITFQMEGENYKKGGQTSVSYL